MLDGLGRGGVQSPWLGLLFSKRHSATACSQQLTRGRLSIVNAQQEFLKARDQLLALRDDYTAARHEFRWPSFDTFNWGSDYFEPMVRRNQAAALRVADDNGLDTI